VLGIAVLSQTCHSSRMRMPGAPDPDGGFASPSAFPAGGLWRVDVGVLAGWQLMVGVVPLLIIWSMVDVSTDWRAIPLEGWLAVASRLVSARLSHSSASSPPCPPRCRNRHPGGTGDRLGSSAVVVGRPSAGTRLPLCCASVRPSSSRSCKDGA
jgi:hypothetical protein